METLTASTDLSTSDLKTARKAQPAPTLLTGLTPIAMGNVLSDGSRWSGTPAWTSRYEPDATTFPPTPRYEITIPGENYYYLNYVTVVTTLNYKDATAVVDSGNGKLYVHVFDADGNFTQSNFSFLTYKL